MPIQKVDKIWYNGKLVDWDDAKVHVLAHALHYGSGVFEGIRCYRTKKGTAVFRLKEHTKRLFNSAKIYRMNIPYSERQINEAILKTLKVNRLKSGYIRPLVFRSYGEMGLNPLKAPIDVVIAVWPWGTYLGEEALEKGISAKVCSWRRMAPNTYPFLAKGCGNYLNSQLAKMEALLDGYDESIMLNIDGFVAEGSGENIFMVKDGKLITPPIYSVILPGITRDSIITIAEDFGIEVIKRPIPRSELYLADELFFTGTAAEVTPIARVDKIKIGNGKRGPITKKLQTKFFEITKGEDDRYSHWLTYV